MGETDLPEIDLTVKWRKRELDLNRRKLTFENSRNGLPSLRKNRNNTSKTKEYKQ